MFTCTSLVLLLALCCAVTVVSSESPGSPLSISTSRSTKNKIPSWLSHIDDTVLATYQKLARERHEKAIQTALEHYNTDDPPVHLTEEQLAKEQEIVRSREFDTFRIQAAGKLPDFHDELGGQPVFVTRPETPLFSQEECQQVIDMAEQHYANKEWPKLPSGQYYIQGFWIKDVPAVRKWFVEKCQTRLFPLLKRQFPQFLDGELEDLVVDQAYLFKYLPQPGLRTEIHTDAGCLSFTFALNSKHDYEGGGTWVEGLVPVDSSLQSKYSNNQIIEMDVGQCTVRPGGIRHCGNPLTEGTRYIIGGFCMNKKRVETVRQLLDNKSKKQTAKEALECAIALAPEFDGAYANLALIYEQEGHVTKAQQVLQDCLEYANPKSTTAAYYLGTLCFGQGQYEQARQYMLICLDVDATDGDAMGTLAQVYSQLGDHQKEHDLYQRIVQTPGVSKRILSNAYCNLGTMHQGTTVEMENYLKSLELEPDNVAARQSLGSAYASNGDWENAIDCYKAVVGTTNGKDEEVLVLLYRASTQKLREDGIEGLSRDSVMARIGELMGQENLDRLLAKTTSTTKTG